MTRKTYRPATPDSGKRSGLTQPQAGPKAREGRRNAGTGRQARHRADGGDDRSFENSVNQGEQAFLPGVKPVLEMLETAPERIDTVFLRKGRHGREMDCIADLCREHGIRFSLLPPESFAKIYSGSSQGVVARIFEAGFVEWEALADQAMDAPLPLILALDQVQDPGNAGTLARTLYALGGAGMLVPRHNGVFLGHAASKASAGALALLPVAKAGNLGQALEYASKLGFTVYGAAAEAAEGTDKESVSVFGLKPRLPAILVLGSEEAGLRLMVEKRCDTLVYIPMLRDFDSINVAQAGAIIMGVFSSFSTR